MTMAGWHPGELAAQELAGTLAQSARRAAFLRPFLTDQLRDFFPLLPFVTIASVAPDGTPWASQLHGRPGFVHAPGETTLRIDALPADGDPLAGALVPGAPLGLLGLQPETRRRNRVNGRVAMVDSGGFTLSVEQAFGNCPKYIVRRPWTVAELPPPCVAPFTVLDDEARRLITAATTAFVASAAGPEGGADVSHRGGRAGFLAIGDDGAVLVPDYAGNGYFNTLGNLLVHGRAGLTVPDFTGGDLLQMGGPVSIQWQVPDTLAARGVERLWRFFPENGRWLRGAFGPQAAGENSPFSPDI